MTVLFSDVTRSRRPPGPSCTISVLVPTYNEAENIRELIRRIARALEGASYEILIVDDDSPDRTWEVAAAESAGSPVRVLRRRDERGLASAVVAGIGAAEGELIAVLDADLSHPPELLPMLYRRILSGADLVVASRIISGGGVEDWPVHRRALSWFGRLLARPLTPVRDNMSGYFMLRREALDGVALRARGYKILLEILVRSRIGTVEELPYLFLNRGIGQSKMTLGTHLDYLRQLAGLYTTRRSHPVCYRVLLPAEAGGTLPPFPDPRFSEVAPPLAARAGRRERR